MKDIRKLSIDKILKKFWDCLKISDGDGGSYSRPHQKSMSGAYIIMAEYIFESYDNRIEFFKFEKIKVDKMSKL